MKNFLNVILYNLFAASFAFAAGGDLIGNSGTLVEQIFEEGRLLAIKNLERFDTCTAPDGTDKELVNWIVRNRFELIEDLKKTKIVMGKNLTETCAWTRPQKNHAIVIWEEKCGNYTTAERAAGLLAHETAHHLGVRHEPLAGEIGKAVRFSSARPTCEYHPFDPRSCMLDPRTGAGVRKPQFNTEVSTPMIAYVTSTVGEYNLHSRLRSCREGFGCSEWSINESNDRVFYDGFDNPVSYPTSGNIMMYIDALNNDIFLQTLGERRCRLYPVASFCDFGLGIGPEKDLYDRHNGVRQRLSFLSVYNGNCLRQSTKLAFVDSLDKKSWTEVEHVLFWLQQQPQPQPGPTEQTRSQRDSFVRISEPVSK